jgi:hypothetical protein
MKTKHIFLNAILVLTFLCGAKAQTANCDLLSITAINPDTINPGDYQVSIQFNGSVNEFIGYPLITSVQNCNGDTVASGTLSWFGQLGQTQQEYPVTATGDISCGPLTVNFQYFDDQGNEVVCPLIFNPVLEGACDFLSVAGFNPDSLDPNTYQINVQYNGNEEDILAGPVVTSVSNCNGEIVATGNFFWFGHAGQTTQEYLVTLTGDLSCGPFTANFQYFDGVGNTVNCNLVFDALPAAINRNANVQMLSVFPNPTENTLNIQTEAELIGSEFVLFDVSGKVAYSGILSGSTHSISLQNLPRGVYFLRLQEKLEQSIKIVKL